MSQFKGTQGKWFVIDKQNEKSKGFPSVVLLGTEQQYRESYGRTGFTINVGGTIECLNANAQLIACAPEMLELLVFLSENIDMSGYAQEKINDLINKATNLK